MRLYMKADGTIVGTQAEAGKGRTQLDVPTDKAGLIAFLNNWTGPDADTSFALVPEPMPPSAQEQQDEVLERATFSDIGRQHRLAERAAFLGTSEEIAEMTDKIGQLEGWPLGQVALAAAARLKELAK